MGPIFMALLLIAGWGIFAYSAHRRWKLLRVGTPAVRFDRIGERLRRTWEYAILQKRMHRYPLAGLAHAMIFFGFLILLPRTLVLWGRGFDPDFDLWILGTDGAIVRPSNAPIQGTGFSPAVTEVRAGFGVGQGIRGIGTAKNADSGSIGTIGGGCGEAEVVNAARLAQDDGRARLVRVDLTDDVYSFSPAVCGGVFDVLLEPVRTSST